VYKSSLQLSHSLSEEAAEQLATDMANEFVEDYQSLFMSDEQCLYSIVYASELKQKEPFEEYHQKVQLVFKRNRQFQAAILRFVDAFLGRKNQGLLSSSDRLQKSISVNFVLEELALAATLSATFSPVSVYPGSIDIFHEISEGRFPELPKALINIINVGICFKKRSAQSDIAA